jgi:O-antigen/teichoic acid export membrane protein
MQMREKITNGLKWSAISKVTSQLVSWSVTIYVIRLLDPSDYGLMAMASVVINFLATINELGLGSALIQSRELNDRRIGTIYGAMLVLGVFLTILLAATSPWIAAFFDEPQLKTIIAVVGIQFIINAITVVPESILRRNMKFKPLAIADMVAAVTGSLLTLFMAMHGYGVWSLVTGNLISIMTRTTILVAINPNRVTPNLHLSEAKILLSYGGYVTAAKFVAYFMSQADILIGAKILGKEALGLYSVSMHLASLPMDKAMSTVNQVAFSAIAKIQDQPKIVKQGLENTFRLLAYVSLPAIIGLASVAPRLVPLLLGDKWAGAILPLQIIAIIIPLRMFMALLSTVVNAMGRADIAFRNTLSGAFILPICFFIGVQYDAIGLAASWLVGAPLVFALNLNRTSLVIGMSGKDMLLAVAAPLISSLIMLTAVLAIDQILIKNIAPSWITLAGLIVAGALTFTAAAIACDSGIRIHAMNGDWNKILPSLIANEKSDKLDR